MAFLDRARTRAALVLMRAGSAVAGISGLKDPQDWFIEALMRNSSPASGVRVTEDNAIGVASVLGAGRILSEAFAQTTCGLLERKDDGSRYAASGHPLDAIMRLSPNPYMTAFELKELAMWEAVFWGCFHAEIEWGDDGKVKHLWPLWSSHITHHVVDGEIIYRYTLPNGNQIFLPERRVFRFNGMMRGGLLGGGSRSFLHGESIIMGAREPISAAMAADRFSGKFFANGLHVGTTLEHPGSLGPEGRAKWKKWAEENKGIDPAHRLMILEEGMKFAEGSIDPSKAQMLETRRFLRSEVSAATRVPISMLGEDSDGSALGKVENDFARFTQWTMDPWFVRFEQAIATRLLTPTERQTLYVKFNRASLVRGDMKTRYECYRIGKQWGWLSSNAICEAEDMNPIEGGDEYWAPMNMIPASLFKEWGEAKIAAANAKDEVKGLPDDGKARSELDPFRHDAASRIASRAIADLVKGRALEDTLSGDWIEHILEPLARAVELPPDRLAETVRGSIIGYDPSLGTEALTELLDRELEERQAALTLALAAMAQPEGSHDE